LEIQGVSMAVADPKTVTQLLNAAQEGDLGASAQLLPLVYDELRRLARMRLTQEPSGQTLQPTALVHEAFLRLVGMEDQRWDSRAHFFGAAARAMRQILIDRARHKAAEKHGGNRDRVDMDESALAIAAPSIDLLALDEALSKLESRDARKAKIVELRYFAGFNEEETAKILGVTARTIQREWRYIRTWLHREIAGGEG
jgi:RNA polymerase sigma factor (TIGR02999 family)